MKQVILLALAILTLRAVMAQPVNDTWKKSESGKKLMDAIHRDASAEAELKSQDKAGVLHRLRTIALSRSMDKPTVDGALELIKRIPSYCEFYRSEILADKEGDSFARNDSFSILARLGTEESLAILGNFLFDPSTPLSQGSFDVPRPSSNRMVAMIVLSEAKITGAPVGQVTSDNMEAKLKEFQEWWLKTHPKK